MDPINTVGRAAFRCSRLHHDTDLEALCDTRRYEEIIGELVAAKDQQIKDLIELLKSADGRVRELHLHTAHASYCNVRKSGSDPCNCGLQVAERNKSAYLEKSEAAQKANE